MEDSNRIEQAWVVLKTPRPSMEGPFIVLGEGKVWVKFSGRKAAYKSDVYYSERDALVAFIGHLDRQLGLDIRRIARFREKLRRME